MNRRLGPLGRGVLIGLAAAVVVATGIAFVVAGLDEQGPEAPAVPPTTVDAPPSMLPTPPGAPDPETARALLASLPRAEASTQPPFDRSAFGPEWDDADRDGCDARQEALARWMRMRSDHDRCSVIGSMTDPYTGETINAPTAVLDRVVPLEVAWAGGASGWSPQQRLDFANDVDNLVPTTPEMVAVKAGRPPQDWMPPQRGYWCQYASVYVGIKNAYGLAVTAQEAEALSMALDACVVAGPST